MTPPPSDPPAALRWAPAVLRAAAAYNLIWGAFVVLLPSTSLGLLLPADRLDALDPIALTLWQCIGMIVGVYGIGYGVAAGDPLRHWPIVLVGLLGKVFGPIGFLAGAIAGTVPWRFGATIVPNDLIWWVPFFLILRVVFVGRATSARGSTGSG